MDPATTWIDADVVLAPDVTILPGIQLLGATVVGEDAVIGPDTHAQGLRGRGRRPRRAHPRRARGDRRRRRTSARSPTCGPGTELGAGGKIGAFVETKNAKIGDGAKVPHLSYVGDAEIGEGTNIGAGTIFANYDGVQKHRTVVGRHARTASNNTFVAPVEIGDGAGDRRRHRRPRGRTAGRARRVAAARSATSRAGRRRKRAGTAQAEAAEAALARPRRTTVEHGRGRIVTGTHSGDRGARQT